MHLSFHISPGRITRMLLRVIGLLLLANLTVVYLQYSLGYHSFYGLVPLFNFDKEFNIPALYSALAIFACAALLRFIAGSVKRQSGTGQAVYWKGLSVLFIFLGVDELISIHEQFSRISGALFGSMVAQTSNKVWFIPYGAMLLVVLLFFVRFFWRLPAQTKIAFVVAGIVFVMGAVGVELLSGSYLIRSGGDKSMYALLYTLEETLEMIGIVLFIRTLVQYILQHSSEKSIAIRGVFAHEHEQTASADFLRKAMPVRR